MIFKNSKKLKRKEKLYRKLDQKGLNQVLSGLTPHPKNTLLGKEVLAGTIVLLGISISHVTYLPGWGVLALYLGIFLALFSILISITNFLKTKATVKVLSSHTPYPKSTLLGKVVLAGTIVLLGSHAIYANYQPGWGVLAINPDKSTYVLNDHARIMIAVLDDNGDMVCDADLTLEITSESGKKRVFKTEDRSILVNDSCKLKTYTSKPDFETTYTIDELGIHNLTLTARTPIGSYQIKDSIKVVESTDFDIKREGATRIYPLDAYEFAFSIISNKDHSGYFEEIIPYNFEILDINMYKVERISPNPETHLVQGTKMLPVDVQPEVMELDEIQVIRWPIEWVSAAEYKLIYKIQIPDISPDFYSIGPASIKNTYGKEIYKENRQWQLAIDAINLEQKSSGVGKSNSVSANFSVGATLDNLLVAICAHQNNDTITGPSGWSTAINETGTPGQGIFYFIATGGETNVSCSFGGKARNGIHIYEYSDIDTTTPYDTSNSATGTGTATNSGSITTNYNDTVLIAGIVSDADGSFDSWTNSFNEQNDFANTSNPSSARMTYTGADRIVYSTGTYITASTGPSASWRGQLAAFKAAAAATSTYTQNDFEWFVDQSTVSLTNVWPSGGGEDLDENEAMTVLPASNEPLQSGDQIRIQMNVIVNSQNLAAGTQNFRLEYVAATDCDAATGWNPVGDKGSATIWRLFDNTGIGDSLVQVNQILTSDTGPEGFYSETNPTAYNPNTINIGENSEWDWPVENNGATDSTTYCFRMVLGDGTDLNSYEIDSYPKLTTAPVITNFMRHGMFYGGDSKQGYFWAD